MEDLGIVKVLLSEKRLGTVLIKARQWFQIKQLGFTLIEMLVIIAVMGGLAAIAAPSLASMMDRIKVDQTIAEVRTALQDTQRQAIRKSTICLLTVDIGSVSPPQQGNPHQNNSKGNPHSNNSTGNPHSNGSSGENILAGNCLTSGTQELPSGVDMATNILGTDSADVKVEFGILGGADFGIANSSSVSSSDSTGKIVALISSRNNGKKRCIAISNTLGLTRVGNYVGETDPVSITNSGICTAFDWDKQ
jgi:prepilin-type N-terminal cleavage/methylation domain-containing protein